MERFETKDWHSLPEEQLLRELQTSPEGLAPAEAERRLERDGPNALTGDEGTSPLRLLAQQFRDPLVYLLLAAAAVSAITEHLVDAGVIVGVVILNALFGFFQEWRAEGALAALQRMTAPQARVIRDGKSLTVDATQLVVGDLLLLESGDRVPADARILQSEEAYVDESALTGESEAVRKVPAVLSEETPLADRENMVWMSTVVTGGRARAVVVATGRQTQIGTIAEEVRSAEREETPLQRRIARLGGFLGIGGLVMALLVFLLGLLRGEAVLDMLLYGVAVAVAFIPEGLPAVISVVLALGVQRMAKHRAIIRRLPAVETLGSTTVICTDKTGTLTENQMTVRTIWAGGRQFEVSGSGYAPEGSLTAEGEPIGEPEGALARLLEIGVITNNARLHHDAESGWSVEGNPSEGALLSAAHKADLSPEEVQATHPRLAEIPFSSDRKYMATLNRTPEGEAVAYVKGAPDRLLPFCTHIVWGGEVTELTDERRQEVLRINDSLAGQALRVLAGAYREMPPEKSELQPADIENGLTLVGLWGMFDPPRAESAQAVADAKRAGIRPIMMTGDHASTAVAIGNAVGITGGDRAITGPEVDSIPPEELADRAMETGLFARLTPANKLRILEALRAKGHIVAMTGDGVNDAPALKGADIGVAMGRAGTEVAKEAADMVLLDDNFATIIRAVQEGRGIYNNLRRVIFFLLATNLGEILTLVGALLVGLPLPLTAVMILWINLVTDGVCTVPLGLEPRHQDVLQQPPRSPDESLLDRTSLTRMAILTPIMALGTLGLFAYQQAHGSLQHAQTVAFTTLAAFQWFQALNARSERSSVFTVGLFSNRGLIAGILAAILLQMGAVQTSWGNQLFGTVPLSATDWLLIVLTSSSIWIVDELVKAIRAARRRRTHKPATSV